MSEIGERLREEVDKLGGVAPTARKLGVATNTIYNWIDKGNIPANKLLEFGATGADVGYILTGVRTPKPVTREDGSEVRTVSPREARILDLLDDLGDEAVRQVQDIVEKEKRFKELEEENARLKNTA